MFTPSMKHRFAFLTALCVSVAGTAVAELPHLSKQATIAALWRVDEEGNEERFVGSGVLIDGGGAILTARHVVFDEKYVRSETLKVSLGSKVGQKYKIYAEPECAPNKNSDVCVIWVSGDAVQREGISSDDILDVSCYRPPKGNWEILVAGFTGFEGAPVLQRTGETEPGFAVPRLQLLSTDIQLIPGMSGGPIIDKFYNVIGVVYGADEASRNLGLFTPLFRVKNLLINIVDDCSTEPREISDLIPVQFFPNPRLMDFRTIKSPSKHDDVVTEEAPMVISVETISYANVQEPGPKARVSNEKLVLRVGAEQYRFAEFQRVNIGTNGEGWLGREGDPVAVTVDDGDAIGHTTQFKPLDGTTWREFKSWVQDGQSISAELIAEVSWKLQGEERRSKISVLCDPSVEEESTARNSLVNFESKGKLANRLTIYCRGG